MTDFETSNAQHLGVIQDSKLFLKNNTDAVMKRVKQTTAFPCRNLSSCPQDDKAKATCCKFIFCPQLKYASTVGDPVTKYNPAEMESVQRCAARFCCNTAAKPAVSLQYCKNLVGKL